MFVAGPSQARVPTVANAEATLRRSAIMLSWAITFLIVAIVAGVLGIGVVAGTAAWIARVLFVVFLILFLISLIGTRGPAV